MLAATSTCTLGLMRFSSLTLPLALGVVSNVFAAAVGYCALENYYTSIATQLDTLEGKDLENALSAHVRQGQVQLTYDQVWGALKIVDASNGDTTSGTVYLMYSNITVDADLTAGNGVPGVWNREHTWPKSRGIDESGPGYTDIHHLRPTYVSTNSARGNNWFDECTDGCTVPACTPLCAPDTAKDGDRSFMPPARVRGDVARSILYMAMRYDGSESATIDLKITNCPENPAAVDMMGKLETILEWHRADPPSEDEIYRNNAVCDIQGNRNPFVDHPELADKIYLAASFEDPVANCGKVTSVAPFTSPTKSPVEPPAGPTPGDIAIVGFSANIPKSVTVVALRDFAAGDIISLSDHAYTGVSANYPTGFKYTEDTVRYTIPAGGLAAGTVVKWHQENPDWAQNTAFDISIDGDTIVVSVDGTNEPTLDNVIFALNYNDQWLPESDSLTSKQSALPTPTLVDGETALVLARGTREGVYRGTTQGTREDIIAQVGKSANWETRLKSGASVLDFDSLIASGFDVAVPQVTASPTLSPSKSPTSSPVQAPVAVSTALVAVAGIGSILAFGGVAFILLRVKKSIDIIAERDEKLAVATQARMVWNVAIMVDADQRSQTNSMSSHSVYSTSNEASDIESGVQRWSRAPSV